jgi:hypothetical protein
MKGLRKRISLITNRVHMPQARIEDLRFSKPRGVNIPFSMTLVEDL